MEQLAQSLATALSLVERFREEARRNNDRRFRRADGGALGKAVHEWMRWSRKFIRLEALARLGRSNSCIEGSCSCPERMPWMPCPNIR